MTPSNLTIARPLAAPRTSSGPFAALGRFLFRRRWLVLGVTVVFVGVSVVAGLSVFSRLQSGGFADPASESSRAAALLADRFDAESADLVLVVDPTGSTEVDAPEAASGGTALAELLSAESGVQSVTSYWATGSPSLRSLDGSQALLLVHLAGDPDDTESSAQPIVEQFSGSLDPALTAGLELDVLVGGAAATGIAIGETVGADLARAESIAIPISLVLMLFVFGSVVAALLPLLVAGIAIVGTFSALYGISLFTDVSIFSINLATALGLGLAIDYSLFIVSRFREELRAGRTTEDALGRTLQTAGRTVLFSAVIVAVSLAALLIFPLYFLRSFGYAGIAVVTIAAAGALLSLPALLAVLGPRVNRLAVGRSVRSGSPGLLWRRLAETVMRRPVVVGLPVAVLLAALAVPFLGVAWGQPDHRVLPADNEVHVVGDLLRTDFPGGAVGTTSVVLPTADAASTEQLAQTISARPDVTQVHAVTGTYETGDLVAAPGPQSVAYGDATGSYLTVVSDTEPNSVDGEMLVAGIRNLPGAAGALVGGASAELVDSKAAVFGNVPLALGLVALTTFVLLFLMTGSLLIPVKAIVLNVLSLGATFGAMVWIFQLGNGADLLGFTPTGTLDTSMPILMFCVAFGLSMDYEVFLLSRIKEAYDLTGDTRLAVVTGLQRTGRILTAAAGVLAVTFIAFATSGVTFIKLLGLGLALAILLDATLVRALLVPAFMRLAGRGNWWAPAPLRRLHERFGVSETA